MESNLKYSVERWLKKNLKNKIAITKSIVISYLMTGMISMSATLIVTNGSTNPTAAGSYSIAIGHNASITNNQRDTGSIAIGRDAKVNIDSESSIAIGESAKVGGIKAVVIGKEAVAIGNSGIGIGFQAKAYGSASIAIGENSLASRDSIAIGLNTNLDKAKQSYVIGAALAVSGNYNIVYGSGPNWDNSAIIAGDSNVSIGANNYIFSDTSKANKISDVIGNQKATSNFEVTLKELSKENILVGTQNILGRNSEKNMILGANNIAIKNSSDSTYLLNSGWSSSINSGDIDTKAGKIIGTYVLGNKNRLVSESKNNLILGSSNIVQGGVENSIVLGNDVDAKVSNSVYIGNKSVATIEANDITAGEKGAPGKVTVGTHDFVFAGAGEPGIGVITVGRVENGKSVGRIIQNLAPGLITKNSTDAVNGSQLYAVVTVINDKFSTKEYTEQQINNATYNLKTGTDGNMVYVLDNKKVSKLGDNFYLAENVKDVFWLNDKYYDKTDFDTNGNLKADAQELNLEDAKYGKLTADQVQALKISTVNSNGTTITPVTITNLKNGTLSADSKEAVNGSQLHKLSNDILGVSIENNDYKGLTFNKIQTGSGEKDAGTTFNSAISALIDVANSGNKFKADGQKEEITLPAGGTLNFKSDNLKVSVDKDSKTVNIDNPYFKNTYTGTEAKITDNRASNSLVIGGNSELNIPNSIVIGANNKILPSKGEQSIFIGTEITSNTSSTQDRVISIGYKSEASGTGAIAIGSMMENTTIPRRYLKAEATGNSSIAIGQALATTVNAIAMGYNATSQGSSSIAIGKSSIANTNESISIGSHSEPKYDQATLDKWEGYSPTGTNIRAGNVSEFSIGGNNLFNPRRRVITYVAPGKDDTDAVNVAQLKALANQKIKLSGDYTSTKEYTLGNTGGLEFKILGTANEINTTADKDSNTVTVSLSDTFKNTVSAKADKTELEAVKAAGIKFAVNDSTEITLPLGNKLNIVGDTTNSNNFKSATDNILIDGNATDKKLTVKLSENLKNINTIDIKDSATPDSKKVTLSSDKDGNLQIVKDGSTSPSKIVTDDTIGNLTSSIDLKYNVNSGATNSKTVSLSDGLDFTNGTNTTAEIRDKGIVKFNLNKDLKDLDSVSIKGNNGKETVLSSDNDGNLVVVNGKDGTNGLNPTTSKVVTENTIGNLTSSINLSYKANSSTTSKTVSLSDGLDFTNGTNTTAEVGDNGVVKFNLVKDITSINSISGGDSNKSKITLKDNYITLENDGKNLTISKDTNGMKVTGLEERNLESQDFGINDNKNRAATEGSVQYIAEKLGLTNNSGTTQGNSGPAGKDGLNGKSIIDKVESLRNGLAGNQVFTDENGNRVVKDGDKYYLANEDGTKKDPAEEVPSNKLVTSLVNPDGTTTNPTVLNNVGSGLGLNQATPLTKEEAQKALNGTNGSNGLLGKSGSELNKAANLVDLQALAQAGLDFTTNKKDGVEHRALGSSIAIIGKETELENYDNYSSDNLITNIVNNKIQISMLKTPILAGLKLGNETDNIALEKDADGSLKLVKTPDNNGDSKVVLKGIKDGTTDDSVATKGSVDALKEALGLSENKPTQSTTGPAGKDGLNGKSILDKVQSLRDGLAGNQVFTDKDGNRVMKDKDGKYYLSDENGEKKNPETEIKPENIVISSVNPDGSTTNPIVLNNVGSGLGANTSTSALTPEQAKELLSGKDGNNGLLGMSGNSLNKAANLSDLQALAQAGINFKGNDSKEVHIPLSKTLEITGEGSTVNGFTSSSGNILVVKDDSKDGLVVKLSEDLKNIKNITLKGTNGKDAVLTSDENGNLVVANGKDGTNGTNVAPSKVVTENTISGLTSSINLTYKANNSIDSKTVSLAKGLDFTNGTNTTSEIDNDGVVKFNLNKDLKDLESIAIKGKDGKEAVLSTDNDGNLVVVNGKDGANGQTLQPSKVATATDLDKLKEELGISKDDTTSNGSTGTAGKDGLDGKSLSEKIDALRNGLAGNQVYTDKAGNRLVQGKDGKYYKDGSLDKDGMPTNGAQEIPSKDIVASLVNPDGSTTDTIVLNNVGSSLGAETKDKPLESKDAKELVAGTNGLLSMKGNDLNKAANLADLQALAQAGLDFAGNVGETHQTLGSKLSIVGKENVTDFNNYSTDNVATNVTSGKVEIGILKTPTFESVKVGTEANNIKLSDDNGALKLTKSPADTSVENSDKVVLTGIKDGTTSDSAVTKGALDDLKSTLGLNGTNGTPSTTGPAGKDGLNGKSILDKVQALRDGLSGNQVFTDKDGNRVVKDGDKYYLADENGNKETPEKEIQPNELVTSLVNPDGTTKTPTVLNNVGSGLGLNQTAPLTKEEAQKAINGVNGNDGLLSMQGKDLNKAANLQDLQALAQAGLDFAGNVGNDIHKTLGSKLSIVGKESVDNFANYSTDNVATNVTNGKVEIGILKTPTFESIKVGNGTDNITLSDDGGALKLTKTPDTNGDDKVVLKGIKDGDTKDSVATKGALDEVKSALGLDKNYTDPITGISAQDGLNGKTILEKIDAIRDGLAGNQVYVDPVTGERLVKGNDGNLYKASELGKDGEPINGAQTIGNPMIALVNPDGTTSNPTVLGNVGSGLGADTKDNPLTADKAKELVSGTNGLLGKSGNDLNKAANLSDLQALAQAGLDFAGNVGDATHQTLGSKLSIVGKDGTKDFTNYSTDNVATKVSNGKIEIGILKTPTFESIKVGDENENITLGKDTDGTLKLTKSPSNPDDKDSDKVVLKGIKDGDTPDSVATKGALDKVKEELGLNGKNNSTITVGPAGKDGLNGETILNKIDALRNGLAGNQVFTDKDGNRVVLDPADGKYYQADENGKKIEPAKEIPANELVTSLVNPDGTTKTPTVLSNVGSGLGTETSTAALTPEQAKNLVSGQDGKSGLLSMQGKDLNKAANLSDLQALAQAGLDFTTNKKDGVEHRTLGSSIAIIGKDTVVDNYDGYSSENLITNITDNKIQISMLKTPTFESVKVGNGTNDITLGNDNGELKLSKEPVANGDDKVVLKGIKDGDTKDSVATKGALDEVKSALGLDGKYVNPTTGISAQDGLNGKTILEKIDAIRDGLAGNQVYVDPATGEKLAKGNDGKLYKVSDLTDGVPNPNAQPVDNPMIALVNPDGTTSSPTVLGNVGSGLGLNTAAPLTKEEAQKAINGVNGNDGLLSMKGNDLNKAANLSDLQALAQAGLDFAGNVGETHQTLGSKLSVIGKDGAKDFTNYSTENVATNVTDGKIEIGILKTPTFENIKVGDATNNITLSDDNGALKLTKSPSTPDDKDSDKVVLKGIKDGDTEDSVATKGALDKVKSELGLDGKYTEPTTGISAKDGLNGKTILEKIDAIRDGLAGNQVYVDPVTGEKLAKGNDGKLYKVSDLTDGVPNQNATSVDNPMIALVNPDGTTSNPTVLSNVGSGLGADTSTAALTPEQAKNLVSGQDGKSGLLSMQGKDLNKAANLSDLQALAQAGLDFTTNKKDGVEHRTLGSTIAIIGKDTLVDNYDGYSSENLITNITDNKIQISMLKTPTFESVKLGNGTDNIILSDDNGALKLTKSPADPNVEDSDKVVLKGIKDGDTADSVATKGALDKVKEALGLDGKYVNPTTGISAQDGLNGKTILEKIDALRDGLAGNQVYVDPATGEKLVKGNDGKLYKASDLTDGVPNPNAQPVDNPMIALVNPDGTTSTPTVLSNVGSGLGADTSTAALTPEKAKELVAGLDGKSGLLTMKGNELNKAANLSDLQALAQAGLDFAGNVGETHQTLGSKLSIVGKDGTVDFTNYSANNIATNVVDGKIVIGMLENPTFNNIYLTSPKGNIEDEDYATGDNGNLAVRRSEVKDLIEKGIKVKTEDKKEFTVKLGGTLEIVGENNTSTTKGNKVDVNTPVVVAEETPTPDSTNNNVVSTVEDNRVVVRIKDRPEFETVIIKNEAKIEDGSKQVVSGNQLYKANKDVADILGMELAEDGSIKNDGFEINGKKYDNLKDSLSVVDKNISSIKEEISLNKSLGDAGIASAIATASIPQVIDRNRPYSIGAGTGIYKGQGAVAVGVSGTNKTGSIVFKASGAVNTSGELSAGAGLAYTFGTTYTPSLEVEKDYTGVFLDDAYTLKLIDQAIKEHEKPMLEEIARLNNKISTLEDQITNLKNSKVRNKLFVYDKFSFDKYELSNNHLNELKELAEYINSSDNIEIEIKGFTDVKGKEDYNLKLGLNRAYAIFDKLVEYGVDRSKIRKVSSSGYNEIVSTKDSNSNRRVEILVIETLD